MIVGQINPYEERAAFTALMAASTKNSSGWESITTKTRLDLTGCNPTDPISNRLMALPSRYNVLLERSIKSDPFNTLGWVISVSQRVDMRVATGVAAPACPPISAPIPVGTNNTALKDWLFSVNLLLKFRVDVWWRDAKFSELWNKPTSHL